MIQSDQQFILKIAPRNSEFSRPFIDARTPPIIILKFGNVPCYLNGRRYPLAYPSLYLPFDSNFASPSERLLLQPYSEKTATPETKWKIISLGTKSRRYLEPIQEFERLSTRDRPASGRAILNFASRTPGMKPRINRQPVITLLGHYNLGDTSKLNDLLNPIFVHVS